jgi:hypothetical protein
MLNGIPPLMARCTARSHAAKKFEAGARFRCHAESVAPRPRHPCLLHHIPPCREKTRRGDTSSQKIQTIRGDSLENFNHSAALVLIKFLKCRPERGLRAGSAKGHDVMLDEFRRRAEECRRLAAAARTAADRAFWANLADRWQALETQTAERPRREKPKTSRRQPELSTAGDFD